MASNRDKATDQLKDFKASQPAKPVQVTTQFGIPVGDKQNALTVGPRGPILLKDNHLIEELSRFDRERIPERVVHAKGAGAFGYFQVTKPDITRYTKAKVFDTVGKKSPVAVRFSTVWGNTGSGDTHRDPRGFAVKVYTEEGVWDLAGNNTPIFFIRDPMLFPSFIHSQKRNPQTNLKDPDMLWDMLSLRPECTHQTVFHFSDRGIPDGYRHMNGYADDPDYSIRDLFNAIANKRFPSWTLHVQIMTYDQAREFKFNPFDLTKVWPHKDFPLIEVGKLVLDRNPSNYFAEVEQLAFDVNNLVPGIDVSPDKMLQARLFAYADTHKHRLGANYQQIPVNRAKCPLYHPTQRDGPMRYDDNQGSAPNYWPNSFHNIKDDHQYKEHGERHLVGDIDRHDSSNEDNYEQSTDFWNKVLTPDERQRLVENIAESLAETLPFIQERAIGNFERVHPDLGARIRLALNKVQSANL
ncbi:unnamed protein product [Oppiella nova]|uniref:Catalase n=1 Tax=Oppiella nova TaxID=334625 RepID=A0A7R9QS79_9ACAR|nr:unnamed protein product [Oppiella nova]CAG2173108.1 unnamed protein product [Oppiella nova]